MTEVGILGKLDLLTSVIILDKYHGLVVLGGREDPVGGEPCGASPDLQGASVGIIHTVAYLADEPRIVNKGSRAVHIHLEALQIVHLRRGNTHRITQE